MRKINNCVNLFHNRAFRFKGVKVGINGNIKIGGLFYIISGDYVYIIFFIRRADNRMTHLAADSA